MRRVKTIGAILFAGAGLLLGSALANADAVTITFTSAFQTGISGDVLEYDATLTNTTGDTEYFNEDSINLDPSSLVAYDTTPVPGELYIDDTNGFWGSVPISLDPGESYTGELFTVTIEPGTPVGLYEGNFEILGGADDGAGTDFDPLESTPATFDVQVTPEPSSVWLLLSGIVGLGAILRRRQLAQ